MYRLSRTRNSSSSMFSCGTTPSRALIRRPSARGSSPNTERVPSVIGEVAPIIRIVDDFPAPFGPRNPKTSPRWMSKSTASTAVMSSKRLVSPRAETSAVMSRVRLHTMPAPVGGFAALSMAGLVHMGSTDPDNDLTLRDISG